ncbi:restriction endonuclease subunit S [Photorhabdus hainanensis]|uniref:restriction endonuclease subunit S n=1 Tax=Photorhabdus hainanensis TaxID=1004166 RepID=UPI001BD57C20|nr:restriction endonuclease subunit S [Photorhabdus hainanensis]MBS9431645.1 restriction endonuclease subunit S [Photorhabdus hainanensis]
MSNMSFMEKLLDGVEVEWKSLGEVGEFIRGNGMQKKDFIETGFPAIHYGQIYTRYGLSADKTFTYISEDLANKLRKANKNDLLLATTSENDEDVVKPLAWLGGEAVISGDMMLFRHDQDVKYLAYYFQTEAFQTQKRKYINGAKVRRVSKDDLAKIVVPIPKKLDIQTEIVRILDAFTELTAKLTAELTARKKQYNYYRDQLLSFEEGEVEWKTLGEIGEVRMCKRILKNQTLETGDIPFYKIGTFGKEPNAFITRELFDEYKAKYSYPKAGEVLISASGTIGRSVIFDGKDAYFQDSNIVWIENDESQVLNKYLFYFYQIANWNISDGGVIKRLYNDNIKKTTIPVPYPRDSEKSLAEQERIVSILDKFDDLTSSISEGLPREIELRQKQYEYYRDLLLSFPKPEVEA